MNKYIAEIWHSKAIQRFVPDKFYLTMYFRKRFGYSIDWKNPKTFNEKMQWLKLYDRKKEYTYIVDKLKVRDFVKEIIGEQYLAQVYATYDCVDEIDYDKLPDKFVLKTNHDSGGVVICRDKASFDKEKAHKILKKSMEYNYYWLWREWPYKNIKPLIICEEYLEDNGDDVIDYKVLCFNGEAKIIQTCVDRNSKSGVKFGFYDESWRMLDIKRVKYKVEGKPLEKPECLEEMLDLACKLSKGLSFVRVDFYISNGQIYFGEMTLYPGSGFEGFEPFVYDELLGEWIELPNK